MARLIITPPDGKNFDRELKGTVVIGRSADCDVSLPGDVKASRSHCKVEQRGSEFVLSDMGSANGTRVNDEKIGQQVIQLRDGDVIGVGTSRLEFRLKSDEPAEPEAPQAGSEAAPSGGGFMGKLKNLFAGNKGAAGGADGAVFGDKTINCSCGAVLGTAGKSPGQKVGCPRCKKIYVIPGK